MVKREKKLSNVLNKEENHDIYHIPYTILQPSMQLQCKAMKRSV